MDVVKIWHDHLLKNGRVFNPSGIFVWKEFLRDIPFTNEEYEELFRIYLQEHFPLHGNWQNSSHSESWQQTLNGMLCFPEPRLLKRVDWGIKIEAHSFPLFDKLQFLYATNMDGLWFYECPQMWELQFEHIISFIEFLPAESIYLKSFVGWLRSEARRFYGEGSFIFELIDELKVVQNGSSRSEPAKVPILPNRIFPAKYAARIRAEVTKNGKMDLTDITPVSLSILENECKKNKSDFARRFHYEIEQLEKINLSTGQYADITLLDPSYHAKGTRKLKR